MDFIKKPFVPEVLTIRVRHIIDLDHLQRSFETEAEKRRRKMNACFYTLFLHLLPQEVVRGELVKGKGSQFDPRFAEIMLALIDEDTEYTMRENKT